MATPLRIEFLEAGYHLTSGGDKRGKTLENDKLCYTILAYG